MQRRRISWMAAIACAAGVAGACGQTDEAFLYRWDDNRVLCSKPIDDWLEEPEIAGVLAAARASDSVALLHAHTPGVTISWSRVIEVLVDTGLPLVTYPELLPSDQPHAALALAFDDDAVDEWYGMRQLFATKHVRVTFFVTRFRHYDADQLAKLAQLAADGHAIEAHGVEHIARDAYAASDAAYVEYEAIPSVEVLRDAGFPVTTFGYPGGRSTPGTDELLLEHVAKVRTGAKTCPN